MLADVKADSLCVDPDDLRRKITPRTRGVIAVDLCGLPCPDFEQIREICRDSSLFLIEDACHAHGASFNDRKAGSLGDVGCFSFAPTKVMTTGTGGILTTDNAGLAEYGHSARRFGAGDNGNNVESMGNSWLMDEISALLGIFQLRALDANVARRNDIARMYAESLGNVAGLELFKVPSHIKHAYHKYPILLPPGTDKSKFVELMRQEHRVGLGSAYDPPLHLQPLYQKLFGFRRGMFPQAEALAERTVCLPIFVGMTVRDVEYVSSCLQAVLSKCQRTAAYGSGS